MLDSHEPAHDGGGGDVIRVLYAVVCGEPINAQFDIGGPDVLPYADFLALYADCAGLNRPQIRLPFMPTRFVGELGALMPLPWDWRSTAPLPSTHWD